jgi:ABC-type multidrug transport system fused ATPase/permease subunit
MAQGKTTIYISHRLSSCRFCDAVAVFDNGALVEYGSHEQLVRAGKLYARMWEAQAQYYQ